MNKKLRDRVTTLKSFVSALQIIKAEIVFRALPIPDILQIIINERRGSAAEFFSAIMSTMQSESSSFWRAVQKNSHMLSGFCLTESDIRLISSALYPIGRYDGTSQSDALTSAVSALDAELESASLDLGQKGKLYRSLGMTAGIMLALIVI